MFHSNFIISIKFRVIYNFIMILAQNVEETTTSDLII
jgi:hypothetical protein